MFTTAVANQPNMLIHVLQGERERAKDNWSLGKFTLEFERAPKGVPRVGVQFEIDANGILHVLARDIKTGKQTILQVKSAVDVDDADVQKMVEESVEFAFDDLKARQWIEAKIRAAETIAFGSRQLGEKGFLYVELDVGGKCLPLVNLHLHFGSRAQRLKQMERLLEWLREKHKLHAAAWAVPPIICGDFNNPGTRDDATAALLSHLSHYCDYTLFPAAGLTFPSPLPQRALDFIFLPAGCSLARCEIVRSMLSDHLPVAVEFDF